MIENQYLKIEIAAKGAELQSIYNKQTGLEYLWQADPAFWPKRSPILFPIIGTLKHDQYFYNDQAYALTRHGFARDKEFEVESGSPESVVFLLKNDLTTEKQYPFEFDLRISYSVVESNLVVGYQVKNPSQKDLYFSIGGHPAFSIPLEKNLEYNDYYLEFNEEETTPRWPISKEGLIEKKPEPLLKQATILPLTRDLFMKDALVLKNPASSIVSIKTEKSPHGLDFDFSGFPFLGLWAAKGADFVCIEPWCGIADPVDTDQQLIHKEGIEQLPGGGIFERRWNLHCY